MNKLNQAMIKEFYKHNEETQNKNSIAIKNIIAIEKPKHLYTTMYI